MTESRGRRPTLITVCSGRDCIGFLLSRGRSGVEAFDANERSIGIFGDAKTAADAVTATML